VSHGKERKEKACLNCNAALVGKFCHICGQENIEPKETFWGLLTHFIYDITHFDGKFFSTLKYLLFKPGFLSYEYLRGRRASYLNPIRMYVFTSAIFFVIYFSFVRVNDATTENLNEAQVKPAGVSDTISGVEKDTGVTKFKVAFFNADDVEPTQAAYDSAQQKLTPVKRDGWFVRLLRHKAIDINNNFKNKNKEEVKHELLEKFMHHVPQMMFVSLPLAALILQLLYVRRKNFYYVDHLIFTVHLYIAAYILLLFSYLFSYLEKLTDFSVFAFLDSLTIIAIFFYIYKAMRSFYQQRRAKTVFKFLLLNFTYCILLVVLIGIFFITSLFQI